MSERPRLVLARLGDLYEDDEDEEGKESRRLRRRERLRSLSELESEYEPVSESESESESELEPGDDEELEGVRRRRTRFELEPLLSFFSSFFGPVLAVALPAAVFEVDGPADPDAFDLNSSGTSTLGSRFLAADALSRAIEAVGRDLYGRDDALHSNVACFVDSHFWQNLGPVPPPPPLLPAPFL